MLHADLWAANADLARACLAHPFVRGLAGGTLARPAFKRYIAQDAFFLRAFLRAYALAAARCERVEHVAQFHQFMGGVLEELQLHAKYARELGIELEAVRPWPACRAYVDFLLRTAWHDGPAETLAAMTPCMRLYAYLGRELASRRRPDHPYLAWIETYAGDEFEALARQVEDLLDALASDVPPVRSAYRYAMQCELDFFSAPLETTA